MSRRPAIFRQSDLQRTLRAAKGAGVEIDRIEIEPSTGKIVVIIAKDTAGSDTGTPLDSWLASHARTS